MDGGERRELARDIVEKMEQLMRIRVHAFREELERSGVTFPQFHLLKMVNILGKASVTELSRLMLVAPPTASRMINSLCDKGMLERRQDPSDQRVTLITLTPRGRSVMGRMEKMQVSAIVETLENEDYSELAAFASLLGKLIQRWGGKSGEEPGGSGSQGGLKRGR